VWATKKEFSQQLSAIYNSGTYVVLFFINNSDGCLQGYVQVSSGVGKASRHYNWNNSSVGPNFDIKWLNKYGKLCIKAFILYRGRCA